MTDVIPLESAWTHAAVMELLAELSKEHELIAAVAGSLRRFVHDEQGTADDARLYVAFFRTYAGIWHHEREEELLVPALTSSAGLPGDRGPVAVLLADHARMGAMLTRMGESAIERFDRNAYRSAALEYSEALLAHIDMEDSVLFPESEARLRRSGVSELVAREITDDERAAALVGSSLVQRFTPLDDVVRGDGCVMCPSFHVTCSGIEREWWNEWEWEEMAEHVAAS
jgi:hemerythrin-like domain-containing protein